MPPQLTVHNAEIKTATVEIKTLTVSGKQVTLAVFRQLREDPYLDEFEKPRGEAWGIVNYHPDKCDGSGQHVHVVWQHGTELRRSRVDNLRFEPLWGTAADEFAQATFCSAGHRLPDGSTRRGSEVRFRWDDMDCVANMPKYCLPRIRTDADSGASVTTYECPDLDLPAIATALTAEIAEEKQRRERVRQVYHEIRALPQLFIAV